MTLAPSSQNMLVLDHPAPAEQAGGMAAGRGADGHAARNGSAPEASAARREVVTVGGRRVTLTHLEKVMYPETGTTKADILGYYAAAADALIRHAQDRPATRKRWVHGVGTPDEPGQVFFRRIWATAPPPGWSAGRWRTRSTAPCTRW